MTDTGDADFVRIDRGRYTSALVDGALSARGWTADVCAHALGGPWSRDDVVDVLDGATPAPALAPALCALLGLPPDLWPGTAVAVRRTA